MDSGDGNLGSMSWTMTGIERATSNSNAEAVGKSESTTLDAMLADHRSMYAADIFIPRLSTESPPVFMDPHTGVQSADPMSRIGPTLSKQLAGYIDYHQRDGDNVPTPSGIFPYAKSMSALRQLCRRSHTRGEHFERPEWQGSLCHELVRLTVARGYHFERACYELGVVPDRTERTLVSGLRYIEQHVDELRARQRDVIGGTWQQPAQHIHHRVAGLHAQDCPQCARAA